MYYLYFGRLSEEKGILTLVKAFRELGLPLYIVGTGPLKDYISNYLDKTGNHNVRMMGFMSGSSLTDIVGNAKAIILPSEWYENGPYSAIEALQLGRPIIGADVGGIPELIKGNGLLFKMGSIESLKEKVSQFESFDDNLVSKMKQSSVDLFINNYRAEPHWEKLKKVYSDVLSGHGKEIKL